MRYSKLFLVAISFLLTACGGGGATDASSGNDAIAEGVWGGTYSTSGLLFRTSALVTSTGEVGIDLGNGVVFTGLSDVDNGQVAMIGSENISGSALVTLGGSIATKNALELQVMQGAYSMSSGDKFSYKYDSIYERGSSLAEVQGKWSGYNTFMTGGSGSNGTWTFTISDEGDFTGDFLSLPLEGRMSLIDSNNNEYSVRLSIGGPENGSYRGNYTGIATVIDTYSKSDTLLVFLERPLPYSIRGRLILMRTDGG